MSGIEAVACRVREQKDLAFRVLSLTLEVPFADRIKPGQFVSLYSADQSRLLPRPISVCEADEEEGTMRLVYRIAGAGTAEFAQLEAGDAVDVVGPLGNGFPIEEYAGKEVLLVGGGIGIPPMLFCAEKLKFCTCVAGYRDSEDFLAEEIRKYCPVYISTDDGSLGTHGTVVDAIKANKLSADAVFACGPMPMLKAVKAYAAEAGIPCYVSLEERMACGVGACLGCVTKTAKADAHTKVNNARICREGPVFRAEDVLL